MNPSHDDLLASVDHITTQLERARAHLLPQLARARGLDAETLTCSLRRLDDKIALARTRRRAIELRGDRIRRMRALTSEMRRIRAEILSGVDADRDTALRERHVELVREAERVRGQREAT
jgi:hypothetical protein